MAETSTSLPAGNCNACSHRSNPLRTERQGRASRSGDHKSSKSSAAAARFQRVRQSRSALPKSLQRMSKRLRTHMAAPTSHYAAGPIHFLTASLCASWRNSATAIPVAEATAHNKYIGAWARPQLHDAHFQAFRKACAGARAASRHLIWSSRADCADTVDVFARRISRRSFLQGEVTVVISSELFPCCGWPSPSACWCSFAAETVVFAAPFVR